jgi:hypothetical protein
MLANLSRASDRHLDEMGRASAKVVNEDFPLARFSDGVRSAANLVRRERAGRLSRFAAQVWFGRIAVR